MKANCVMTRAVEADTLAASGVVLIVDDDAAVRRVLRTNLERLGMRVLEAINGMEAWTLFQETRGTITLVITDIRMPKMNGIELALKLVRVEPNLPVILLAGSPEDLRRGRCRLPVIEKPVSWSAALEIIRVSLDFARTGLRTE
jgi:two-component system, cell cycle sensor histidine kinase and response regulator CckA